MTRNQKKTLAVVRAMEEALIAKSNDMGKYSAVMERKTEALAAHDSQREWLRKQHGIDEYLESMTNWSAEAGKLAGLKFAEGFRQHLGHAYPRDNLLASLLEGRCHQPETGGPE